MVNRRGRRQEEREGYLHGPGGDATSRVAPLDWWASLPHATLAHYLYSCRPYEADRGPHRPARQQEGDTSTSTSRGIKINSSSSKEVQSTRSKIRKQR